MGGIGIMGLNTGSRLKAKAHVSINSFILRPWLDRNSETFT